MVNIMNAALVFIVAVMCETTLSDSGFLKTEVNGESENELDKYAKHCQDLIEKQNCQGKRIYFENNMNNSSKYCEVEDYLFIFCKDKTVDYLHPNCCKIFLGLRDESSLNISECDCTFKVLCPQNIEKLIKSKVQVVKFLKHMEFSSNIGDNSLSYRNNVKCGFRYKNNESDEENADVDIMVNDGYVFNQTDYDDIHDINSSFSNIPIPEALSEHDDILFDTVLKEENVSDLPQINVGFSPTSFNKVSFVTDFFVLSEMSTNLDNSSIVTTKNVILPTDSDEPKVAVMDVYQLFRSRYPVESWKSLGLFTDDYIHLIDKHWLQFQPPYHSSHYILAALYTLVMTVGVTGNSLVIFMFLRCRSLRTPANVLVMNLAISDFVLLAKMSVFIFNSFYFGPALGAVGCEVYGFLGGLTGTVSIMTLAAIALDRYYVIVYPLERLTTRQRARLCVILAWCYGALFAVLPLTGMGLSRYVPEGYLTSCSFDYLDQTLSNRIFILVFFLAAWAVPFFVITFCYTKIYRVVISGSSGASSRRGQEQEKRKTEVRLAGVVIGVIILWFVAWTPYAVVALLGISGNAHLISPLSSMIPALFCKTASCMDPFIYAVTHPRFRREFNKFFCQRRARRRKLEGFHGKTQCWKTETSKVSGMMVQPRRTNYSYSEDDVEEMVVMVDSHHQKANCFTNSSIAPEVHNVCEITFPLDRKTNQRLQHPSWFASPYLQRDRSTSLRVKTKSRQSQCQPDPISV